MMAVAIAACTFTSCEDVPEPYNNPYKYLGTDTKVDPKGEGTLASPFNVAAALAKCEEVGEDGTTTEFYATGYVTELTEYSAQYGNMTFKIADKKEGGDALTVYRAKGFKGENITDESLLHVGDSVVICGKLVNFKNNTPEFTQGCYIVSINGKGGGVTPPTPTPTGDNLLANGDFETWEGSTPTNWDGKAGSATLSQSTDKHSGTYAVMVAGASGNKRLSYKAITLKAGTYNIKFYAKGATTDGATVRPGYVAIKEDGSVDSQNYKYGSYTNDIKASEWTEVAHSFTLSAETTVCLVVMNPGKSDAPGVDVLIDDFELTTSDGGIADGSGDDPTPTPGPTGDAYFIESFENGQGSFTIDDKVCTGVWTAGSYGSDKFMKATSFINKVNNDAENWLISPLVDLTSATTAVLKFAEVINSYFGTVSDEAMVYAKKENDSEWTKLSFSRADKPSSGYTKFTDATANVSIDLASFKGAKMQFAFVYKGTATTSGTWEVKDVSVVPAE